MQHPFLQKVRDRFTLNIMAQKKPGIPPDLLIESQYFPPVSYFSLILLFDKIHIEAFENYKKQSYRNRCLIRGPNKIEKLIVPVMHASGRKGIRETRIDYSTNWHKIHRRALMSAYGKSPFYEYFAGDFFSVLERKHRFLMDLNMEILSKCLDLLHIRCDTAHTSGYEKSPGKVLFDARDLINPKKTERKQLFFHPVPYYQVFGKNFAEDLSILDLLMCEGPVAIEILRQSNILIEQ